MESCYSISPCVLLYTSFLPLFLSYPVLLPPFKWDEWTYLCNNAITSQRARVCECLCVLCVTYSGCWHSLILRENTDAAFCFCPCFTSRLVFISTMVIGFSSFYGPCVSLNGRELEGHPLIQGAPETPCHSAHFYRVNLLWMLLEGKWPLGNCNKQNACEQRDGKQQSHRWDGQSIVLLHYRLVFHYMLIKDASLHSRRTNAWSETRCKIK